MASEYNPLLDEGENEDVSSGEEPQEDFALPFLPELTEDPESSALDLFKTAKTPKKEESTDLVQEDSSISLTDFFNSGDDLEDYTDTGQDTQTEAYKQDWGSYEDEYDDDPLQGLDLDLILGKAIEVGASDVDIIPNDEISFEILGEMHRLSEFGILTPDITTRLQLNIISHVLEADFVENLELDTAYVLKTGPHKGRRMRLSVGKSFGEVFLVFRVIADQIPTPGQLGIPNAIQEWCQLPNGLVLICGPTGSGKSTSFSSMIRKIQLERAQKIITIEKPIEFVYGKDGRAVIVQREVGRDARTFAGALKSAMRQHPKIIMVGEVRDQEEVDEILRAAETGHLALTTLHATSPPGAINRIMSLYEGEDRLRILSSLKDNVRGIANQTLVKTKDGKSRFALHATLSVTPEVSEMIGAGDVEGLQAYMRDNELTMEHQLARAVREGRCHLEDARSQAAFPQLFDELVGK